jgi:hypothetical protein
MAQKVVDLYREHKSEYITPRQPALVKVGRAKYLAISGEGAPASPRFQEAIGALYAVAFTIKMAHKFAGKNYKVCHLEGLWCTAEGTYAEDWSSVPPEHIRWKLLIRVPEFIGARDLKDAAAALQKRGKKVPFAEVKLEMISEGTCVQQLHVGAYDSETATLRAMRTFAAANKLVFSGVHHEIYLSDPGRVPKERLRTILRYPVKRAAAAAGA